MARHQIGGHDFALDDPDFDIDPTHRSLQYIPEYSPTPETYDDEEYNKISRDLV